MGKKFRQNFRSYVLVVIRRLRVTARQVADYSLQKAQRVAFLLLRSYLGAAGSSRSPDRPSLYPRTSSKSALYIACSEERDICPPHHWTSYWTNEKRNPVRFLERILPQVQALRTKLTLPELKKVLIALDQNFRIVENRLFSQRSATGCVSIKPETPSICLAGYVEN